MDRKQVAKEIRSAIKEGNSEKVVELIGSNSDLLNMMTPFGSWLHVAASRGELGVVKKLVEIGSDINMQGGVYGGGALNEAASEGHIDIVRYLLSNGAEMDISEPEKNPLFGAISNGHVDIAELLIEKGIDIDIRYTGEVMKNMDALAFAREQGQEKIVKLLENKTGDATNMIESNDSNQDHHFEMIESVSKYFGSVKKTISEIVPGSSVAVNIHIIPPSMNQNFVTLVTTGMSDEPMDYSNEEGNFQYAELIIKLPASWKVEEDVRDIAYYWPISWLKKAAHIPHIYNGWLDEGVIIPNGEPPHSFATNTKLSCIMICRPQEDGLDKVQTKHGDIKVFSLIPIYEEERNLALEKGYEDLLKKMSEKGISDVLDIHRENVGV